MRQQVYVADGDKLVHNAFGYKTLFHSKNAAKKHAEDSGAEAVFDGNHDDVPEYTPDEEKLTAKPSKDATGEAPAPKRRKK